MKPFWKIIKFLSAIIIAPFICHIIFPNLSMLWGGIVSGLLSVLVYILISVIVSIAKSANDPDVLEANQLCIPIWRYNKYKEWNNELTRLIDEYGADSKEVNEYFHTFFSQVKYPNEWRRYCKYQLEKQLQYVESQNSNKK